MCVCVCVYVCVSHTHTQTSRNSKIIKILKGDGVEATRQK